MSSGGASYAPPKWRVASQGPCRSHGTGWDTNRVRTHGGECSGGLPPPEVWYRAALEMQAKPCYHTMEHQTSERVDLYARRLPPGDPIPINLDRIEINDNAPLDEEIRTVVSELLNGRAAGASGMRAEQVKEWLRGICRKEDPQRAKAAPAMGTIGAISSSWSRRPGLTARSLTSSFGS